MSDVTCMAGAAGTAGEAGLTTRTAANSPSSTVDGVRIRVAEPADAPAIQAIYAPYVRDTAITFEYDVPSVEEMGRRMAETLARYPYLVAERIGAPAAGNSAAEEAAGESPVATSGELLGYAYAGPFKERAAYDWAVETSIYVRRDDRAHGIGGQLYQRLERALTAQGILNLEACIAFPAGGVADEHLTSESVGFHEHLGYRLVGEFRACGYKFGRWYDMVWMEKFLGEHLEGEPQPPVAPFPDVRDGLCL